MEHRDDWLMITKSHTWGGMNNNSGNRKNKYNERKMPDDFCEHIDESLAALSKRYNAHSMTIKKWKTALLGK